MFARRSRITGCTMGITQTRKNTLFSLSSLEKKNHEWLGIVRDKKKLITPDLKQKTTDTIPYNNSNNDIIVINSNNNNNDKSSM